MPDVWQTVERGGRMALVGPTDTAEFWDRLRHASGHLMFDVGANAGGTARMFSERYDKVIAFEPCFESYTQLAQSLPPNVVAEPIALSDHLGSVTLIEAEHSIESGQLVSGEDHLNWGKTIAVRPVACSTLDLQVVAHGVPDAVKVDTEGHEVLVLTGARDTIKFAHPVWYIEVHDRNNEEWLRRLLPDYQIEVIRHALYPEGSDEWLDHFYMVAT